MMAASNLENQLHSAQKNLLFLQREHASTLKGLHAEIRRLQQHCTDVTKQGRDLGMLAGHGLTTSHQCDAAVEKAN
uniref:Coiled-coil domain containing 92 n=1 Tax=Pelusios castaneus TaxID=367368 RepID=A0A8C8SHC9_9SAUR